MVEALEEVETYQFDISISLETTSAREGEPSVVSSFTATGRGTVDNLHREIWLELTTTMPLLGEPASLTTETYIVAETLYTRVSLPETPGAWIKQSISDFPQWWQQNNELDLRRGLLQDSLMKRLPDEEVQGIDSYVLGVTPDIQKMWQFIQRQGEIPTGAVSPQQLREMFKEMSMKAWIAKDTYLPLRFETQARTEMSAQIIPEFPPEMGKLEMSTRSEMQLYNYNQPVSIELPPEAREAAELP
jgi:hypothetical protein